MAREARRLKCSRALAGAFMAVTRVRMSRARSSRGLEAASRRSRRVSVGGGFEAVEEGFGGGVDEFALEVAEGEGGGVHVAAVCLREGGVETEGVTLGQGLTDVS